MRMTTIVRVFFVALVGVNCADQTGGNGSVAVPDATKDVFVQNDTEGDIATVDVAEVDVGSLDIALPECEHAADCEDYVQCTENVCYFGTCDFRPDIEFCNDSDPCTIDLCNPDGNVFGGCEYKQKPCDDNDQCTFDVCDSLVGCVHTQTGGKCDDNDSCTNDFCEKTGCDYTQKTCDDGDPTTFDGCVEATGCYHTPMVCGEGFPCVSADLCVVGKCNPDFTCSFEQQVCIDGIACTIDSCLSGICVFIPQHTMCPDDGTLNACIGPVCDAIVGCTLGDVQCDDNKPYTTDVCDPQKGCVFTDISWWCDTANQCDLGDGCMIPVCNPNHTCSYFAMKCDDEIACTTDSCVAGLCVFNPQHTMCPDDNDACALPFCDGVKSCTLKSITCDDNNSGTSDTCDPIAGCVFTLIPQGGCSADEQCSDTIDCTLDSCIGGECVFTPQDKLCSDDGNFCTMPYCSSVFGCSFSDIVCDDKKSYTIDTCNTQIGCVFTSIDEWCDTADQCNDGDGCKVWICKPNHTCTYNTKVCNDKIDCTIDACLGASCVFTPQNELCPDDLNACTTQMCDAQFGCVFKDIACNDNKPSTADMCDPQLGCVFTEILGWCENANQCNDGDGCKAWVCNPNHTCSYLPKVCDDKIPCTIDQCIGDGWCQNFADDSKCPAGLHCIWFGLGGCAECAESEDCSDGSLCTYDYCKIDNFGTSGQCIHEYGCGDMECDADKGSCYYPEFHCLTDSDCGSQNDLCVVHSCVSNVCVTSPQAVDGTYCSQDPCAEGTCQSGVCVLVDVVCDDSSECTTDSCDVNSGCVFKNVLNGSVCKVGKCLVDGTCNEGDCGNAKVNLCQDSISCTTDACDPVLGCTHTKVGQCAEAECLSQNVWGCDECNPDVSKKCPTLPSPITSACMGYFNPPPTLKACEYTAGGYGSGVGWTCPYDQARATQTLEGSIGVTIVLTKTFGGGTIEYHVGYSDDVITFLPDQFSGNIVNVNKCACIDFSAKLKKMTFVSSDANKTVVKCKAN